MRWIAALMLLAGCGECGAEPPPPPSRPPEDASIEELAPEPTVEELLDLWKAAVKERPVGAGEPATLRYAPASCTLRYQLRALHLNEVAPGEDELPGLDGEEPDAPELDELDWAHSAAGMASAAPKATAVRNLVFNMSCLLEC